jgi:hypothetical protein
MARHGHKHKAKDLRKWGENKRGSPFIGGLAQQGYHHITYAKTADHLANRAAAEHRTQGGITRKSVHGRKRMGTYNQGVDIWFSP